MRRASLLRHIADYYSGKVMEHGPAPQGADWNSIESQELRFDKLLQICSVDTSFALNDYGCGYGALALFMARRGLTFTYSGLEISSPMAAHARRLLASLPGSSVYTAPDALPVADYTVASGVLNVKLTASEEEWGEYTLDILDQLRAVSRRGFGFNMLTRHCDRHRMRRDLYYADPSFYLNHCLSHFSRRVRLLHDYPLYEFTILVWLD